MEARQPGSVGTSQREERDETTGLRFRDVVVQPFTELIRALAGGEIHQGGPSWPDWQQQTVARHCRRGSPVDAEPPIAEPTRKVAGPLVWGGPIVGHFGHQVADFSMRLMPSLRAEPGAHVLFSSHQERLYRSLDETPPFFPQILEWIGLGPDHVHFVTEPTLVSELQVWPQAEQLAGPGPSEAHLDYLSAWCDRRLGVAPAARARFLYVSRAGMPNRIAGESYIEEVLRAHGAHVLRPETVPLVEQLRSYASSERIVFSEGSALHALQFLGRGLGDVTVLKRRRGVKLAHPSIAPRTRTLEYVNTVVEVLHGVSGTGSPLVAKGCSILDGALLRQRLDDLLPGVGPAWRDDAFAGARDRDVIAWLTSNRSDQMLTDESRSSILAGLEASGLQHLSDFVPPKA
jgi:hypothetical protein